MRLPPICRPWAILLRPPLGRVEASGDLALASISLRRRIGWYLLQRDKRELLVSLARGYRTEQVRAANAPVANLAVNRASTIVSGKARETPRRTMRCFVLRDVR